MSSTYSNRRKKNLSEKLALGREAIYEKGDKCFHFIFVYDVGVSSHLNSLATSSFKQTTKFSSVNFQKNVEPKLHHIENSKSRE